MIRIFCSFLLYFASFGGLSLPAHAGEVTNVVVGLHQAELVRLPQGMTHVIIADRDIGGIVKHDDRTVSVIGHGIGHTDIRIMSGKRIALQINLTVTQNLPALKKILHNLFPHEMIGVEMINRSVALTGKVSSTEAAKHIMQVAKEYIGQYNNVINLMSLRSGQQVMLRVRVGEMKRDTVKKLGLGLHGVISAGSSILGLLNKEQQFRILAEPNLTAISGETAQFVAGGEFPVPVAHGHNAMSVAYKTFGIQVHFTPMVLADNRLRVNVSSEVSELNNEAAVSIASMKMPSISTRRASTTVELAPGESFMIAGLTQDNFANNLHQVPGLANIPVLSALFSSVDFRRNESELVIAVTPYLVDPVKDQDIRLPGEGMTPPSPMELFFVGGLTASSYGKQTGQLEGSAGYIIE